MHMSEVCTAIGRQLQADYLPVLAAPIPGELQALVAQLVTLEASRRELTRTSAAISAVAQRTE
jgi:hypothetical protein